MKALILCAGMGQRLRPMTLTRPKCMVSIHGQPVLERIVDHLHRYGIEEIIVNIHWLWPQIPDHFGTRLIYSYEQILLGEEKTIKNLKPWLGERFLVVNGDTLSDVDLKEMINLPGNVKFMDGDMYAGYQVIDTTTEQLTDYRSGAWWQDMGTHEGLEKAREKYEK